MFVYIYLLLLAVHLILTQKSQKNGKINQKKSVIQYVRRNKKKCHDAHP